MAEQQTVTKLVRMLIRVSGVKKEQMKSNNLPIIRSRRDTSSVAVLIFNTASSVGSKIHSQVRIYHLGFLLGRAFGIDLGKRRHDQNMIQNRCSPGDQFHAIATWPHGLQPLELYTLHPSHPCKQTLKPKPKHCELRAETPFSERVVLGLRRMGF